MPFILTASSQRKGQREENYWDEQSGMEMTAFINVRVNATDKTVCKGKRRENEFTLEKRKEDKT